MKLLLYCTKSEPQIFYEPSLDKPFVGGYEKVKNKQLNGKIVAECDFEVEEISKVKDVYDDDYIYETPTLNYNDLLKKSCLNNNQLEDYLEFNGYAIHIKNLNIFDKPKDLDDYVKDNGFTIEKAPQNMMYAYSWDYPIKVGNCYKREKYILISIRPEYLVKILNKEKTIEIRKKVLKEMMSSG